VTIRKMEPQWLIEATAGAQSVLVDHLFDFERETREMIDFVICMHR
jgi:hypothetical protein